MTQSTTSTAQIRQLVENLAQALIEQQGGDKEAALRTAKVTLSVARTCMYVDDLALLGSLPLQTVIDSAEEISKLTGSLAGSPRLSSAIRRIDMDLEGAIQAAKTAN